MASEVLDRNMRLAKMEAALRMGLQLAESGNHDGENEACPTCRHEAPMITDRATLKEFDRLYREAEEVSLSRDEFLDLIFQAAAKLTDGSWKVPQITNCYVGPIDEFAGNPRQMGVSGNSQKVDVL